MTTLDATRPLGWRVRISLIWAVAAAVLATALVLTFDYSVRIVEVNRLYLISDYRDGDFEEIDAKWQVANSLVTFFTPLYTAAALLLVLVLIVHARGWQLTQARARATTPGRQSR